MIWMVIGSSSTGDAAAAIEEYRAVVELVPGSEFHRLRLAEAERLAGRRDAAAATAREAVRLDPRFAAAWLFLAGLETTDAGRLGVGRSAGWGSHPRAEVDHVEWRQQRRQNRNQHPQKNQKNPHHTHPTLAKESNRFQAAP